MIIVTLNNIVLYRQGLHKPAEVDYRGVGITRAGLTRPLPVRPHQEIHQT
jgi:hypothetical protein